MEPALWELNEGNENEEVGVIIRLHQPDTLPPNVRLITQFGEIATVRLLRGAIVDIRQDEAVASMKAPDLLTPGDEVLIDAEDFHAPSIASDNRRPLDHDDITGKDVVLGVVDWGCAFTHPNFRRADGTTRLLALWDQSAPYDAARPNRYGYGVIHTAQAINEALASDDPAATLGYFFSRSDPSGSGTHGTHVLDIAAGNGYAGGSVGVAPEADLVFVHLHNLAFPSQVNLGDSVAVLEAADFILDIAQDRPVVMNFSMGRQMGPHDGSTLVEQGFDAIVTTQPGRAIVQSTGNYFDRSAHSSGQILPGQVITIPFVVSPADVTPNELEIWYPGRDVFTIAVRSPDGIMSKQTGLDDQSTIQVSGQTVCKVYHRAREPNNLDNNCHVYMENGAPPGRWEVILTGVDIVDGRFNIWIERDATCPHCQSRFEHNYVVPLSTTGTICNGLRTIAVGAYNAHDPMRSLGHFSSSGPTRDGRRKPNLIAPGVQILAARSGPHRSDSSADFLVRKSGTSMAAPHVAGAVALMFDLANQLGHKLAINDTLNLLLGSTTAVEAEGDEIHRIGSGMLDTDAALEATRTFLDKQFLDKPFDIPVPSEISNLSDASERTAMNPNLPETIASETTGESDWLEAIESEIESQIPVQTHFNRILQHSGLQTINSLRDLFMMFARPSLTSFRPELARMFDAIAVPGGVPIRRLRPGDVLLRYIPGEGYIHITFIHSDNLLLPAQATARGWTLETMRPGYYGVVVEAGTFPHRAQQRYARRVLDARGTVPPNQLILGVRRSPIPETVDEQIQIADNDEQVQPEDIDELWGLDDDAESILIEDIYENNPPPMTPTRSPMAVPSSNPAPFAPLPPVGSYWPIITNHRLGRTVSYTADDGSIVGQSARRWLADRSSGTRYHIGIDLFANNGDPVVAIEDGEIVDFRPFCCGDNKTTNSLLVAHANIVVNYGEVAPDSLRRNGLSVGSRIRAGQIIAYVGRNPGGSSMIHFETYAPGTRRTNRWMKNQSRPANVLNPTQYLLHLQEHGMVGTGGSSGSSVPTTPTTPSTPSAGGDRRSPAYIRWVQSSLNQVMNAGLTVDGISGSRTRASVRTFQRSRGLAADGIVGAQTEAALIAAGATPPPLSASEELMADLAESGSGRRSPEYIRWVQSSLNQIDNAGLVVDGISGPRTREAVRNFQRTRGLMVDGIVGPQTEAALIASGAPLPPTVSGASIPIPPIPPISPIPPAPTPVPITPPTNWVSRSSDERMRYVMDLLVREYLYSINGAAGIVGNLWAESGVLPNRVEGSSRSAPMTAPDFNGRRVEFTADQVMNRNRATRQGPRLPGVGLAQWTTSSRRAGLFLHTFQGQRPGADILYNMDAQVNYLVTELQSRYRQVDSFLRRATVSLEDASDEVLYNYEVPGSILSEPDAVGRRRKLPRHDAAVIRIFEQRRGYARNALRAYTSSAHSGSETDEVLEILDGESVLHQCLPGEGPPAAVPDPEGRGLHPLIYRGTGQLRSRNPTVGDAQQLLNRFLEQIRSSLDSCDVRTAEVQRVISQGRAALQRSGQDPLIVDCRFGPSTETATKMFQACKGLVQDGKIGPRTWEKLALLRAPVPPVPPVPPVLTLNPTRWAPILRRKMSTATNLRTGNAVKFLIDGLRTFQEMVDAISMAQSPEHYIYLLGWILKDNFPLIPGVSSSSFRNLLSAAASRGVQVRAMLWDQVGTQNSNEVDRINRLSTGGAILDNETPRPISGFGSHHQKVLIVKGNRGLITFCGGIDVNDDRIPASSSSGGSGSSGGGTPLHDVHCRIIGPSAHDLLQTFIRRWDHHPDSRTIDSRRGALLGRSEPLSSPITTSLVENSSTGNSSTVCIARTFNPVTRSGTLRRERDVRELLIEAIRNAQRFIYMEDQYLIHLVAATELRAAVPRLQHLTILIAASELSDLPCVWKFRRDFINALTTGLNANDRAKVRIFFLVTPPPSRPPRFGTHTYVHAKTWIFDDELAVIGSANCNRRGWEHDSEVNAFIFDDRNPETGTPTFAQELRKQLWAEHLNVSTSAVDDGVTSAGLWLTPPAGARVMPYDPTAGSDLTPDAVCDRTVGIIDPTP